MNFNNDAQLLPTQVLLYSLYDHCLCVFGIFSFLICLQAIQHVFDIYLEGKMNQPHNTSVSLMKDTQFWILEEGWWDNKRCMSSCKLKMVRQGIGMSMMESFSLSTSLDASTCVTVASIDVAYVTSRWKSSYGFPSVRGFAVIIFSHHLNPMGTTILWLFIHVCFVRPEPTFIFIYMLCTLIYRLL